MKVSVFTATLDRPQFLARAVESVLAQTHQDWELIVYNVGGPVVLPRADPRVRLAAGERRGPAADFQAALELARGELVTPLSDDDRLPPHALETAVAAIGDAEWLVAMTLIENERGDPLSMRGGTVESVQRTLGGVYMLGGAVYWRKRLTDRLGGFDSEFDGAADFDLYARFARDSWPNVIPDVLYVYTDHPGTDSNARAGNQQQKSAQIARRLKGH